MKKLIIDGLVKLFSGILLTGALTFIPAGTLHFWQGEIQDYSVYILEVESETAGQPLMPRRM